MRENYRDITSRIVEEPIWFDSNGTPRYDDFHPNMCPNIYSRTVVLAEIACQYCGRRFRVEMNADIFGDRNQKPAKKWHYGDPPIHDCVGDTMNCEDLEILEFWDRNNDEMEWRRDNKFEGLMD